MIKMANILNNEENLEKLNIIEANILKLLEKNGPMTRKQLYETLKAPRTTVYDHLAILLERDLILRFERQINPRGRPWAFFKLKC